MSLEEKVISYRELALKIAELESEKKLLSQEILMLMPRNAETLRIQNLQVKRFTRLTIKTSLEDAKIFGAIKIEEVVDKDALKKLLSQGIFIPDITESTFIIVSKVVTEKEPLALIN